MISYWDGAVIRHSQVGLRHAKQVPDLASKRVLCQPSSPVHQHHTHTHHAPGQATWWQRTDGVAHISNVDARGVNLGSSAARGQKREPTLGALHDERLLRVCVINAVQNERRVAWQTTPSKCAHMSCGAINPAGVDRRIDTHRSTARRPLRL